ncbi:uncharacterized protein M421DRAFT_419373 [Didymella exigua CBS 183.55]|uniref:Uncharacterized protein n=1 Tax=Didymella exigua CBS 183.55 TaxID=1150837 RepID=A0A6A5RPJ8_9PLEO|nr:uncharacterized protein M421DRAFT_419373 [Didymella exigua CBS 183.55]KAF1929579.1 hypothetical protein M421DRAFT_419373 [Didymella exigua CBS 183.55]
MSPATKPLTLESNTPTQQDPAMSPTSTPSSSYSQIEEPTVPPMQAVAEISPMRPRLLLPPTSPYSIISPYSPDSPHTPQFPYSPLSAAPSASLNSPYNPFLASPAPRLTINIFRLASPLLPASPLLIFDRAISPTSPAFLLSRTPSPGTPNQQLAFLRTATPSIADCTVRNGLSPTLLWPRTPPAVPH